MAAPVAILDASAIGALVLEDEEGGRFLPLLERAAQGRVSLLLPLLAYAEVANLLWKTVHQARKMRLEDAQVSWKHFLALPCQPVSELPVMDRALELAIAFRHPVYDMVYLALAEARGARVYTCDQALVRKAKSLSALFA